MHKIKYSLLHTRLKPGAMKKYDDGSGITRRFPARPVIGTGMLLVGLGFCLISVASTIPLLALTVIIWTFGEMIHSPVAAAYVANLAPPSLRGRYQGIWGLTWSSGLILGPLLGTLIFLWNPAGLWLLCGLLGIVSALLVVVVARDENA